MKIIWALPFFHNPQTGGEKVFKRLADLLKSKNVFIINTYQQHKEGCNVYKRIQVNISNFIRIVVQDKHALIFLNLPNRRQYLFKNFVLHFILRRKIIFFIHEVFEFNHLPLFKRWCCWAINHIRFKATSLIVVNSKYTGNWVSSFGDFKNKVYVMYPVLGIAASKADSQKKINSELINILCVGNIRKNKGQMYLLQALKSVQHPFKITFVGLTKEKDYLGQLKKYVLENRMTDKVEFVGFLNGQELVAQYQKANIFVLPTLKEGFGMAVLEALSYGLPVIVSNVGAIPEIITQRFNGILVKPEDPESIAEAILELLEKPDFHMQLRKNAIKRPAEYETINKQFDRFYERVKTL
ncbi:MAG: glycosyltransferase family 4 protein [Candidatus Scalindua sp.]